MLQFNNGKQRGLRAVWVIVTVLLAVGCKRAKAFAESSPSGESLVRIMKQSPGDKLVINLVCGKIIRGDFESAEKIVNESAVSDSQGLRELRKVIDEYTAIKTKRKVLQHKGYQTQIKELEKLRQKGFSDNANDISKVFSIALKTLEYADNKQRQALLRDFLIMRTVRKAKAKAAEFEAKGKWLDAYTICYNKLVQIYQDNEAYSDHAEQLLEKADILASLQDSPCETCEERYAGIKKQMFINAVDILDSSYVNIIDYRRMSMKGIDRCKLLAEVMSKLDVDNEYKITNAQYVAWLAALEKTVNKINQSQTDIGKDEFVDVFNKVLAMNESSRAGTALLATLLITQFAKGTMSGLDPYTAIYWPSQVQDFEKAVTNQFSGIGIKFSKQEGLAKVVSVLPDTPADKSGLQSGDIIRAVDGVEAKDISSDCVVKQITGPEGTKVTLTIRPSTEDKTRDITLERARIIVPSVHGWQQTETGKWRYMIDVPNKIGYVRISSFNSRTADDFESALCQLEKNGLEGLILDLRSNPGGLLSAAVEIADKFIREGLIVRTQPRFGMSTYISAHQEGTHGDYPIVVLINPFTASASEILAGVLQDQKYKRAFLVGQRSYGKGSVQSITSYCGNGAQLKYTVAYYHLPSGQRVESRGLMEKLGRTDWGILPSVNVELKSNELQKIANVQKANESVATIGKDDALTSMNRYSNQETIDADPQLAIGLLVLKSKMIQAGHELAAVAQQSDRGSGVLLKNSNLFNFNGLCKLPESLPGFNFIAIFGRNQY
ncbi:MAG: S41 family peptidase [Planctomycetota bacterium]